MSLQVTADLLHQHICPLVSEMAGSPLAVETAAVVVVEQNVVAAAAAVVPGSLAPMLASLTVLVVLDPTRV